MLFWLLPTLNPRVCCWNVCAQKSVEKKNPTKNMWCKLFSSLRTKLNDDEIYYYYYYYEHYYIYDTTTRLIIMVATMMMMIMMMMNYDSCCLTVPLTILLTGAQVKNLINQHQKKKEKSLNKPLRAAWPSCVCSGPVSHVLFWCPSQSSCWIFVVLFPNFHLWNCFRWCYYDLTSFNIGLLHYFTYCITVIYYFHYICH